MAQEKEKRCIRSLLDTDLYKFTMLQVFLHQYPSTHGVYHFRCRNLDRLSFPLVEIKDDLEREIDALCEMRFEQSELDYLRSFRFIKSDFVDYLELFQFQRRFIQISRDEQNRLDIRIEGPIIQAMFFEIFVLSIVSELYFRRFDTPERRAEGERRLQAKCEAIKRMDEEQKSFAKGDPPFLVSDFGTRRRFNFEWQDHVIGALLKAAPNVFRGTSNVYLAKKYGIAAVGTMAHEYLQSFQAQDVRIRDFQTKALECWVQEYRGDLGTALTDVVNMDAFLSDFDLYFAKLFDGIRHDSGDPYVWGEKAYAHYQKLRIDTRTKMLTFSDGLDLERAWALHLYFKDRFKTSFGIGTNLTNDLGMTPLNIVLKLVECNGQAVAKITDSPGKTMTANGTFLAYMRQVFGVKPFEGDQGA